MRFYHKFASVRKEHNRVKRLKDVNGKWQDTEAEIQNTIFKYFENIYLETETGEKMLDEISFKRIIEEQTDDLVQGIIEKETQSVVFAMCLKKSPGIDGLKPCFFQSYWNLVNKDVFEFCKQFFEYGELPVEVNCTLVCLILKVKHPKQVFDLRHISPCNVLMRILCKVVANRLKPCWDRLFQVINLLL